jgi:hypothetical protein
MRRAAIIAITLLLAACGGSNDDSKVTTTQMDNIDNMEGTISDEMVDTDQLNEQAMVEAEPAAKPRAKADKSNDDVDDKPAKPDKQDSKPANTPKLDVDPGVAKGE